MKIPLTYMFAGLLAWAFVIAVYISLVHHPVQTLVIPVAFLLHLMLREKFSQKKSANSY